MLDERGQERIAGLRGTPKAEALGGQQVRQVQRLRGAGQGRQPVRIGDQGGLLGHRRSAIGGLSERTASTAVTSATASTPASPAASHRSRRRPRASARARAWAARSSASACALDASRNSRSPAVSSSSAAAAQSSAAPSRRRGKLVVRPVAALPLLRGRRQVTTYGAPGGVLVQPPGQPRPAGEQRLVGDVETVAVERQQPPSDEAVHHRPAHGPGRRPDRVRRAERGAGRATRPRRCRPAGRAGAARPRAAPRRARPRPPRPTGSRDPATRRPPGSRQG